MDQAESKSSADKARVIAGEALHESIQLLNDFSHTATIGFAILDRQLRFQAINSRLAAINGVPADAHLGNPVRDILGVAAETFEPLLQQVFACGETAWAELSATLPTRTEPGYWLEGYFPMRGDSGRVTRG